MRGRESQGRGGGGCQRSLSPFFLFPCFTMSSSDFVTEVEVQPEIQEVEIEAIPVDMPVDAIETYEGEPIIALQQLPEPGREEIIFQTQEEVVGEQEIPYEIPVPVDHDVCVESSPGPSKRQKKGQKRRREVLEDFTSATTASLGQKWEQKQVQIKTLEGEFSVTMWSSGVDEGKCQGLSSASAIDATG